jgi:hypothetical protein
MIIQFLYIFKTTIKCIMLPSGNWWMGYMLVQKWKIVTIFIQILKLNLEVIMDFKSRKKKTSLTKYSKGMEYSLGGWNLWLFDISNPWVYVDSLEKIFYFAIV